MQTENLALRSRTDLLAHHQLSKLRCWKCISIYATQHHILSTELSLVVYAPHH